MCAAVTTTAVSLGISGYMAYQGAQDKKRAQEGLNNYDRQDLKNPYENVQISTVGSDLMREESQRTSANLVDASRNSGIRGVMGAIPKIQAYTNLENRDAQKYLDDQVQKREYAIAGDETNLRAMKENRDNNNISALSTQYDMGRHDVWNGLSGVVSGVSYGANNIDLSTTERSPIESVKAPEQAGVVSVGGELKPSASSLKTPWYFDKKYSDNLELMSNANAR